MRSAWFSTTNSNTFVHNRLSILGNGFCEYLLDGRNWYFNNYWKNFRHQRIKTIKLTISYTKHVPPLSVYILTMIFNWYLNPKKPLWLYCITHFWSTVKCLRVRVDKLREPGAICYLDNKLHLSILTSVLPLDTQQYTAMIRRSTPKCQTAISKSSSCTSVKYIPKLKCSFEHSKMSQTRFN